MMTRKRNNRPATDDTQRSGASPAAVDSEPAVIKFTRRREEASCELESAIREFHEAESRVRQLNAEIDKLSAEIDKLDPPPKTAEVIQTYLQSELDLRVQRAREKSGPAPIDRALARNRSRGVQRPQFPNK